MRINWGAAFAAACLSCRLHHGLGEHLCAHHAHLRAPHQMPGL